MRLLFPAAILLALCGSANADEFQSQMTIKGQSGVGLGMICDTPEQTDRFLALRNGGADTDKAAATVNAEARDPRACGKALVAFRMEEELQKARGAINEKIHDTRAAQQREARKEGVSVSENK